MIMRKTLFRIPTYGDAERNACEQGYEARRGATAFNPVPRLGIRHKSSVRNHWVIYTSVNSWTLAYRQRPTSHSNAAFSALAISGHFVKMIATLCQKRSAQPNAPGPFSDPGAKISPKIDGLKLFP